MFLNLFGRTMQPYMDAPADPGSGNPNPNPAPVDPVPPADPNPPENPTPTDPPKPADPAPEPQKIKIKFNHEEKEILLDEAVQLAQKGLNYDKVTEKLKSLESNPALSFVEQQAKKYDLTTEQYIEAVRQQEEQARLDELVQQNIPEDVAKEIMENRKFREQWESEKQGKAKEEAQKADALAFISAYPDVKFTDLPESVLAEVDKGKSLVDAYRAYENQQLREQVAKLNESLGIQKKNAENAQVSTGSVTGQGNPQTGFFTADQVKAMSQSEVAKNYDSIMESMKLWK